MEKQQREHKLWKRHIRIYKALARILKDPVSKAFNYSYDTAGADAIEGPVIVIPNHACAWDPILTAIAFRKKHMYFVASENILRWKILGPIINTLVHPIPRKKAGTATGTVMTCLRHLKAGHSIALFAEGEQTWTGISEKVFPATGKLAKQGSATLVTFRIEGAYLALPRWASGIRRGKVYGHTVNIYTPEMLKNMTPAEISEAIDRDIFFDIWKWQDEQPEGRILFAGQKKRPGRAEGLEKALFICPECGRIGTLSSSGDMIQCTCGFKAEFSETGFLEGVSRGIDTIADWDKWQSEELIRELDSLETERLLFRDNKAILLRIEEGHRDEQIAEGPLEVSLTGGRFILSVGDASLDMADVRMIAMVLSNILLIRTDGGYYQIQTENVNLRKYLQLQEYLSKRKEKDGLFCS